MVNSAESKIVSESASWGNWIFQKCADGLQWLSNKCQTEGFYDGLKSKFSTARDWVTWAVDGVKSIFAKFSPSGEAKAAEVPTIVAENAAAPKPDQAAALKAASAAVPASPIMAGEAGAKPVSGLNANAKVATTETTPANKTPER